MWHVRTSHLLINLVDKEIHEGFISVCPMFYCLLFLHSLLFSKQTFWSLASEHICKRMKRCVPSLLKMPQFLKVITLRAVDRERKEWLAFMDDQTEEEAISLHLRRSLRSLEYHELESQLVPAVHGDKTAEYWGLFCKEFLEATGHRVTLFCQKFKYLQIWRIKKSQSFSLSSRLLYHLLQTDFSDH